MPNCKICGKPVVSGVVLHEECLDKMIASAQNGQSAIDRSEMFAKIVYQQKEEIEHLREIIDYTKTINAENIKLRQELERLKTAP